MSVTYQQFLDSAKLFLSGLSEMDYRNAASRGYYAAYHICLKLGKKYPDFIDDRAGLHEKLIRKLESAKDRNIMSIGYILRMCRSSRKKADYLLDDIFSKKEAELTINQAEKIIHRYPQIEE